MVWVGPSRNPPNFQGPAAHHGNTRVPDWKDTDKALPTEESDDRCGRMGDDDRLHSIPILL